MHNIYIDSKGKLFDGFTCDVSGMTQCELDSEGQPYKFYNLDGTPDMAQTQSDELEQAKSLHKANWLKKKKQAEHDAYLLEDHNTPIPTGDTV